MRRQGILKRLKQYKEAQAARYGILAMGVFGSVARNPKQEPQDIDVWVRTKTPNPFVLVHIKEDLEALFQAPVDIVRLRRNMNAHLKKTIEEDGIHV